MSPPPPPSIDAALPSPSASARGTHAFGLNALASPSLRRLFGFLGPGYLVAIGYMDPGNWATDLAGGSAYGYSLLWIVLLSSGMAMVLQMLAAKLGIVSGLDLAQACRAQGSRTSVIAQWLLCEAAICACDLAEVIGTAIALKLLFGIPVAWGVALTVLDVLLLLWLHHRGFKTLESVCIAALVVVALCFGASLALAQPQWRDVFAGFLPTTRTFTDPDMLYIAIAIIGATVMPHNLYLHSSMVQGRHQNLDAGGKKRAIKLAAIDVVVALGIAFLINAAILVTASAVFHSNGHKDIADLEQAYVLIGPITGSAIAAIVFGVALLASGVSSAMTATMAGQIVMEGYVRMKMPLWKRRLLTRGLAIVPALFIAVGFGDSALAKLLVFSQVVLSIQLPFAMVPLLRFTANRKIMGEFSNHRAVAVIAWTIAAAIIVMNAMLFWKALSL